MKRMGAGTRQWFWALVATWALAACNGGDEAETAETARPRGAATVQASGGSVTGEDGVRVTVPDGALAEPVAIRVAKNSTDAPPLPDGLAVAGHVYAIQPHGQTFAKPVQVRLPVAGGPPPAGSRLALAKADPGGVWRLIENVALEGAEVVAEVDSFSLFLPVFVPAPGPITSAVLGALPEYQLVALNSNAASDAVAGSQGRVYRQASPARLGFRIDVNVPARSAMASICPGGSLRVHTGAVTRYRLPTDAAGTVRLGGYVAHVQPVATLALTPGVAQAVSFDVGAADRMFDTAAALPPGAVRIEDGANPADITGVSVDVDCGTLVLPNVVPRFAVASDFSASGSPALVVDLPDATPAALDSQTLRIVVAHMPNPVREGVVFAFDRSGTQYNSSILGQPSSLPRRYFPRAPEPAIEKGVFRAYTFVIPQVLAELDGWRFLLRADGRDSLGSVSRPSRTALLTIPGGAPPPRFTSEPQDETLAPGDAHSMGATFISTPLPSRFGVCWELRPNADAPWESVCEGGLRRGYDAGGRSIFTATSASSGRTALYRRADAPLTIGDNGLQYRVAVSNAAGNTYSRIGTLTVTTGLPPPALTLQPADVLAAAGSAAQLTAAASGGAPLSYQWYLNGRAVLGGNRPTLAFAAVNPGNAGDYQLEVLNPEGRVLSRVARLTVTGAGGAPSNLAITAQPASLTVPPGASAGFAIGVSGASSPTFQWRRNGADIAGATAAAYTIPSVAAADAGAYTVVVTAGSSSLTSQVASLNIGPGGSTLAPTITTQPTGLGVRTGQTATLAVAASGSGPLSYQWQRQGADLAGATGSVLVISNAQPADAGSYTVTVRNAAGSATSAAAMLVVTPDPGAPTLTRQPAPAAVLIGATATFTAAVSGNPAPQCLWLRAGIVIPDATSCSSYTTPTLTTADDGVVYNVFAYSAGGHVFGSGAVLTVRAAVAPAFTQQPDNQGITPGASASFTASASGLPEPGIEWGVNGGLLGASGRYVLAGCSFDHETVAGTLALRNVTADCDGAHFVALARNVAGTALSNAAVLTVRAAATTAMLLAGSPGVTGSTDGSAATARFSTPNYLAVASDGGIAIGDFGNSTLRVVAGTEVRTLAGSPGVFGFADGTGSAARFNGNGGLAFDRAGNLFVADWDNHVIRRVTPEGVVTTFAGSPGAPGSADGTGSAARFTNPNGLAIDGSDNIYVVDWGNHTIRKITPTGVVSTFAGAPGQPGSADGPGGDARFSTPGAAAIDGAGNLYVTDMFNHTVRKITPAGEVSTLAGAPGLSGTADGAGSQARFEQPAWISATTEGTLFVVSAAGDTVRRVSAGGVVETVVGVAGEGQELRLGENPRLRGARGVWALGPRELLLNAHHALLRILLP